MEKFNAEQVISELDCQTRFAKFSNSNGVLISVKCAQFVLDHAQYYEQRIKELTEENERFTRLANLRQRDLDNANDLLFKVEDENERLKEFAENIKTAPIVKIDEEVISKFAIKRAIRNYELHFGKSAQLEKIAKEMVEGEK